MSLKTFELAFQKPIFKKKILRQKVYCKTLTFRVK